MDLNRAASTMTTPSQTSAIVIRNLNDSFRKSFVGGAVVMTPGVSAMPALDRAALLRAVRAFEAFNIDNDPHGEHDFGAIDLDGTRYFFKLDYYDLTMEAGSPNPADPAVTRRVLTIMRADEY